MMAVGRRTGGAEGERNGGLGWRGKQGDKLSIGDAGTQGKFILES